jgi:hypothetical protein
MRIAFRAHGVKIGDSLSTALQKLISLAIPLTPFFVSAFHPILLYFHSFFFLSTSTFLCPLFLSLCSTSLHLTPFFSYRLSGSSVPVIKNYNRVSSVDIRTGMDARNSRQGSFLFSAEARPNLRSIQTLVQWLAIAISSRVKRI